MAHKKHKGYRQQIRVPSYIKKTARFLEFTMPPLAIKFASRLFETPIRFKMPHREHAMDQTTAQHTEWVPELNKEIMIYQYGKGEKLVLILHGWSGRGTQLFKIADALKEEGYAVLSIDAPAHGKTKGKTTNMLEFIKAVEFLDHRYGPFYAGVGHSLGGMSLMNAASRGVRFQKLAIVGSGDQVMDIALDFTRKLGMKDQIAYKLKEDLDKRSGINVANLSASIAAKQVHVPVLVIHDEDDLDVPVSAAHNIHKHLQNSQLMITEELGHNKILGNKKVIHKIVDFFNNK
ncbi:alpha/beta hydrolase [Robertkochia solimangrovi]|uniref:alpha/beta hydrolase n=1 Tax=Robertkochia solimangrovi TaxID=2213046 RepID=UPI00117DDC96|nr:alpha/beta hydrolase [Robertkochia solimangrovi]TRZ45168.1 alpha/beta hydrolase [Robertkochia solimangrovi]